MFANEHAHIIDNSTEENKLEYTTIYNEFQQIFEEKLTAYIESKGSNIKEFYDALRVAFGDDENGEIGQY